MDSDIVEIHTLWHRLKNRFDIVRPQPKTFILGETVQPITNVDFVINKLIADRVGAAYTGTGTYDVATVPTGKRWLLHSFGFWRSSGTAVISKIQVAEPVGNHIPLILLADLTEYYYYLPHELPLAEGYRLSLYINGMPGAAGNIYSYLCYAEMDMEE